MSPNEPPDCDFEDGSGAAEARQDEPILTRYNDDEVHDLICVGFGPASLAIAVALYDAIESNDPMLSTRKPKVRFLERQETFAWHAGLLLPGTRLQISFIKDLATLRNPRSKFTFLNYLHERGRLVTFTNLGTFLPLRLEYEDYLRWCASHFADVIDYGQTVETVKSGMRDPLTDAVQDFIIGSKDKRGVFLKLRARHVVIAVGGRPNLPAPFDVYHPQVLHSSQYAPHMSQMVWENNQPSSVAVIGAGQSAAEVFYDISTRFPHVKCSLLIRGSALRPSDDSPFVNEIFDPERVDEFYAQEPNPRANSIAMDKATNYSVVRIELLEAIYSTLYSHRISYECEDEWPQRILTHRKVTSIERHPPDGSCAIRLHLINESQYPNDYGGLGTEQLDVDLVVLASGYRRDVHRHILKDIEHLIDEPSHGVDNVSYAVGRDYGVRFREGAVGPDAGIWLQGCNESTHGLSDTLLSILSTRGGEMVNSIFRLDRSLPPYDGD